MIRIRRYLPAAVARLAALILASAFGLALALPGQALAEHGGGGLSARQRSVLQGIAADT